MTEREVDPTLDAQLRHVPVPDGLTSRLRGIAAWSDEELDVRLRSVPVPVELTARLQQAVADEALDERLRSVPVPVELTARLQQAVADEALDERLRDVPVPVEVLVRARRTARRPRRSHLVQWALAASLLVAIGGGFYGGLGAVLYGFRPRGHDAWSVLLADAGPLKLSSPAAPEMVIEAGPQLDAESDAAGSPVSGEPEIFLQAYREVLPVGPAGRLFADVPRQWNPWDNWLLKRWGVLGFSHHDSPSLPELKALPPLAARGVAVPLERGFDREFLYSRGLLPPAFLATDKPTSVVAPLTRDTASFDLARRAVAAGRWPEPSEVHVEDFIAAAPYRLAPAAPHRLAIRTAAGPAVFSSSADGLLQVAVTAGPSNRRRLPATRLTVAVDISESMGWGGRLELVRRGLESFLTHLGPDDRLSIVLLREEALQVVDGARREETEELLRLFDGLRAGGGINLCVGLQRAVAAALENESHPRPAQRLVVITGNAEMLTEGMADKLRPLLGEARSQGLELQVLDVSGAAESPVWTRLVEAARGAVRTARSAADVRWALVESLTGAPSVVAAAAQLRVEFRPQAVAAYRLIGHECTHLGGLLPASTTTDLRVGEETSVLFELWLYPQGGDELGMATLDWQDPSHSGTKQVVTQRISRVQFAASFEGSPLSLQAAALAAEAGEVFRQAYGFDVLGGGAYRYHPKPRTLHDVLAVADRINPALAERPEFRRFLTLLEQANRLVPERRSGLVKAGARGLIGGRWREAKE